MIRTTAAALGALAALSIPAGALAAGPVERRLHVGQAEASSYDKNDWNRFEENYLPLYVADDDPVTAWTEGAEGDGPGQWLRLHHSTMKGATRVRLKIRNGYQKSPKLFAANARARKVSIKLLPGGATVERELTDSQGWQEVVVEQPSGELSGLELKIVSTFPGKKYADLCISDVQLFVTAETPDNPAYEKSVFERVKKWKSDRVAAAAAFKKAATGRPLPVAPAYQSDKTETTYARGECEDFFCHAKESIARIDGPKLGEGERAAATLLTRELAGKLASWQPVQLVADAQPVPAIDGTCTPGFASCEFDTCDDPQLPLEHKPLLERSGYRLLEMKEAQPISALLGDNFGKLKECQRDEPKTFTFASRQGADKAVRALLVVTCGLTEGREGEYPSRTEQLLVYGDDGRLRLTANRYLATSYRWEGDAAAPRIAGGSFTTPMSVGTWKAAVQVAKGPGSAGK